MSAPTALTQYKKQDGTLSVSQDRNSVSWTPAKAGDKLSLAVSQITNLQQTPADKPNVMLKILHKDPSQPEPVAHVFKFPSTPQGRAEANAIRDALSTAMAKASQPQSSAGQSAAMTIAAALSHKNDWEDNDKLIADVKLQQALLKEDAELQRTFMEARSMKPDSLSLLQFTKQFWSSRVHLLRAHSLAQSQSKGLYNVFSEIKRTGEGGKQLNLTSEHIKAIFEQYPLMRIVYDEVVPKRISDDRQFWSRFFQSQLYSTLRGLKIDRRLEAKDAVLDQYLDHPALTGRRPTSSELHIPKFIDLEGNEENHSQRQGNRPDAENRQSTLDKGPIIRRLNAISENLMAAVRPSDVDASAPIGMDETAYEQLRLRDLATQEEQQRITLNIRDASHLFATQRVDMETTHLKSVPADRAIRTVTQRLEKLPHIEVYDEEDEDEEGEYHAAPATEHILSLVKAHRDQASESTQAKAFGLSEGVYERVLLTQATTLEFLRQFWAAFLSGDASRTGEVASLVESLNRALERINAVAADAQAELDEKLKGLEAQVRAIFEKTGRRQKVNRAALGGGGDVVRKLLEPMVKSLGVAVDRYRVTFEQQSKEMSALQVEE